MNNLDFSDLIKEFQQMLTSNHYVTFKSYNNFLKKYKNIFENHSSPEYKPRLDDIISNGYRYIDASNQKYIEKKLVEYKEYFDNMFYHIDDNVKLDEEQRKAILNEEDYSLIIAGAGAGKTTTMAAKVKYLIEKKNIPPSSIAVISYTNKATEELEDKIKYQFNLPVDIMTFHSLGIKLIRKSFKQPLKPVTEKEQREIIENYVKNILFNNKDLLTQYVIRFNKYNIKGSRMFSKGFTENYEKFSTFQEYFNDYKRRKYQENKDHLKEIIKQRMETYLKMDTPKTLKNEHVRSEAEANIANFLFLNGIEYKYEEPYPEKVDAERVYLPDFTIEINGIPIYIEYYGLSGYYEDGTLSEKNKKKYEELRKKKRAFHDSHKNYYIELDYKYNSGNKEIPYLEELKNQLEKFHVKFQKRSLKEIYEQILDNNMQAEFFRFVDFMLDIIQEIKESPDRELFIEKLKNYIINEKIPVSLRKEMLMEANLFLEVYKFYENNLIPRGKIDFSDMIYYANKYITSLAKEKNILDYQYIVIDEYQDISIERYKFAKNLSLITNSKVVSVGDDWQTIFSFAGSRIDLFYQYAKLFPGAKRLFINSTYRNSQQLIEQAGMFIMKNPLQIKKNLISLKKRENPIKVCLYDDDNQYELISKIIMKIYNENQKNSILILSRKNRHIEMMLESSFFKKGIGTRIICSMCPNAFIDAMSVHSAKGLGSDYVILMNVTNTDFPCSHDNEIWLKELFKPKMVKETYPHAEERRIFYVALTRTKNDVYILAPKSKEKRSPFIEELFYEKMKIDN